MAPRLPRSLPCPQCSAPLDLGSLEAHFVEEHLGSEERWACGVCQLAFATFDGAATHCLRKAHSAAQLTKIDNAGRLKAFLANMQVNVIVTVELSY